MDVIPNVFREIWTNLDNGGKVQLNHKDRFTGNAPISGLR
jgi:hypothetical protein